MHAILGQCSDDKREYFNKRFCLSAHRMAHQKFREADGRNFLIRGLRINSVSVITFCKRSLRSGCESHCAQHASIFPLEATDNGLRLKIDACCAQWLSHPDRRERLQNVMTLTELIRKSPDQEVSAVSFAEFLMRHPMRAQTEAFVEILALVIATLAKYCMHFNVCSHAQWPPFRRTLLNPLSDGTPAFESRLWQEALCLSHQIIYDQSSGVRALNPELCADAPLYGAMPLFHTLA